MPRYRVEIVDHRTNVYEIEVEGDEDDVREEVEGMTEEELSPHKVGEKNTFYEVDFIYPTEGP